MKHPYGWFLFLAILLGLVLLDGFLWHLAHVGRAVGAVKGFATPLDRAVDSVVRPSLTRQELERELLAARDWKEYAPAYGKLLKHLGDMGDTQGQRNLREEMIDRFCDRREEAVVAAYEFRLRRALARKDGDTLRRDLNRLRDLALEPPPDGKLLRQTLSWAYQGGLAEWREETIRAALPTPNLPLSVTGGLLRDLLAIYKKRDDPRAEDIQKRLSAHAGDVKLADRARNLDKRIEQLLKKRRPPVEIWTELELARDQIPENPNLLNPTVLRVAEYAAVKGDGDTLRKAWDVMAPWERLQENSRNTMRLVRSTHGASIYLFGDMKPEEVLRILDAAKRLLPEKNSLAGWIDTELWLRRGRAGPPPVTVYRVAYRPKANIVMDGALDEPVYGEVAPLPGPFWVIGLRSFDKIPPEKNDSLTPDVRIFFTDTHVYLGIRAPEPHMDLIRSLNNEQARQDPWRNDSFEFFLDETRRLAAYHQWMFSVNELEAHVPLRTDPMEHKDLLFGDSNAKTDPTKSERTVAVTRQEDGYTAEYRFPLTELQMPERGIHGMIMLGNIRRLRHLHPDMVADTRWAALEKEEIMVISWAPILGGHNPQFWNLVEFE